MVKVNRNLATGRKQATSAAGHGKKKRKKNPRQSMENQNDPSINEIEQQHPVQSSKRKRKKNDQMRRQATKKNDVESNKKLTSNVDGDVSCKLKKKNDNLSLASRLKRERGTAATTPLPPKWKPPDNINNPQVKVLSPDKDGIYFESCKEQCYKGFHYEKSEQLPQKFHDDFSQAFDQLNENGLFLYDAVQPGKKRLSRTMVTRTLVGEPGSTYKYLGLRLFSHPWCDDDGKTLSQMGYTVESANALYKIGELNQFLIQRTKGVLSREIKPKFSGTVGSAEYSLTLINRMEPSSVKSDLRNENIYGLGKTSVSWHKDSGLQDFSSIAVYHTLQDYNVALDNDRSTFDLQHFKSNPNKLSKMRKTDNRKSLNQSSKEVTQPWKVALRIADPNNTTPALAVPLPSGSVYYLLDDFNHQHEHAVITGTNKLRYSSTHRVARAGCGTWNYLDKKCNLVVQTLDSYLEGDEIVNAENKNLGKKRQIQFSKDVRSQQQLMTEIEFEWIRQWYVQGKYHADFHRYWHEPMTKLEKIFEKINHFTTNLIRISKLVSSRQPPTKLSDNERTLSTLVTEDIFDVLIEAFIERQKLRLAWNERLKDPIFSTMPDKMKPFSCSILQAQNNELQNLANDLRRNRNNFVNKQQTYGSTSTKSQKNKKKGSLTKKEQKLVASNWERMKSLMKS